MTRRDPTQYPFPQSDRGPFHARSLRTNPQTTVRQPYLASPPQVVGVTNMGTGGGAFILNNGSDADKTQGMAAVICGAGQAGNPVLTLNFPAGIVANQYLFFCDWGTLVAGAPAGGQIALTITPNRTLVQGERLLVPYQLAVSS